MTRSLLAFVVVFAACGDDIRSHRIADAGIPDANQDDVVTEDAFVPDEPVPLCTAADGSGAVQWKKGGQSAQLAYAFAGGTALVATLRGLSGDVNVELYFSSSMEWLADEVKACASALPDDVACGGAELIVAQVSLSGADAVGEHPATVRLLDGTIVEATVTIDDIADEIFADGASVSGSINYKQGGETVSGTFTANFCTYLLGTAS